MLAGWVGGGWLVGWLAGLGWAGWLAGWLVGWLAGWLVGWLGMEYWNIKLLRQSGAGTQASGDF